MRSAEILISPTSIYSYFKLCQYRHEPRRKDETLRLLQPQLKATGNVAKRCVKAMCHLGIKWLRKILSFFKKACDMKQKIIFQNKENVISSMIRCYFFYRCKYLTLSTIFKWQQNLPSARKMPFLGGGGVERMGRILRDSHIIYKVLERAQQ